MLKIKERNANQVTLEASGTIQEEDYYTVVPQLEDVVRTYGKVRALMCLDDFKGWSPSALTEELKFGIRHRHDIERCAVVGDNDVQRWMTKLASPFFDGDIRFFPKQDMHKAQQWLKDN